MNIIQPTTPEDMDDYLQLRWEILRAPWNQPIGSEQDEYENIAFHVMAKNDEGLVIGAGRIHSIDSITAQIRYMAILPNYQNQGTGSKILQTLENKALSLGTKEIILNARQNAVNFYQKHNYIISGEGHTLFGSIHHKIMCKHLL